MSIVLVGSTSGSITLQEPAVSGSTVLSLPAVSGTILTTASSGQSIPKAALPTGSVLQVVNYTGVGYAVSSTSTWAAVPDLSLAITPQFSTSKILVISTIIIGKSTSNTYAGLRLVRGSTVISTFSDVVAWTNSSVETTSPVAYTYLDSPATTSSTTYKIEYNSGQNSTAVIVGNYINSSANTKHSITLMEIAA
jgi:hypothetical protein